MDFLIFMVSSCLGGSGWISIDSLGFTLTWHDLKRTDIFVCWIWRISLDSCRNGNIVGWVWEDLDGFDWIWGDLVGFCWIWVQIRVNF